MYDAFERHSNSLFAEDTKTVDSARKMIIKIVNSLGAKTEIGAPMAALYLLGNPDKYSSHEFVNFYWKNYVNYVRREWDKLLDRMEMDEEDDGAREETENVCMYDEREREAEGNTFSIEDNEPVMAAGGRIGVRMGAMLG
ncbi:hypothetical protein CC1G_13027 [Coprinopsis cinerea okayama7|uniref:Uncharacterized protein n=1 Tax=Coprinopsis cinerea (strain Okayama-7 / 130 / ATCC MYA-4618 / FGSC 9003) TaxID=240176 RepID=A8PGU6_COPC7|nr:hypothetical protein CC1G_13027 [Coprinopsis cinerea okayama7\|eukprot:XP_001841284.2 hypothetical protein CC1G_13027 [Coprinopsis cinerea okayama7\